MKKFIKNHKGVTMVEVLVTVAMLAIVVAPCLSSFVMAQRGNVKAAETQAAYTAAANLMEELKGLSADKVTDRLDMGYSPTDDSTVKPNQDDGVHVISEAVKETNGEATIYYRIWIYAGEDSNVMKSTDDVPGDYILKGVIAP